jgi:hypothetical protein
MHEKVSPLVSTATLFTELIGSNALCNIRKCGPTPRVDTRRLPCMAVYPIWLGLLARSRAENFQEQLERFSTPVLVG